ncbi:protein phosphatase 1 regulatory subunit 3C-like [Megalops cyprinoides]|uniref:protein phosphatase 1 regulatory subunit 3C-like n=1 Tax=Megalops cyprinoides TaxID=118141 RepID=UPI00186493FC|nr:protein phosphatase 1 regulatory subunit 3C-like [Megalops cyprinoides]
MSCTKVLHVFGGHAMPPAVMPMDLAARLCLPPSPDLCHLLGVSTLKPRRSRMALRAPRHAPQKLSTRVSTQPALLTLSWAESRSASGDSSSSSSKKKRVVFADAKGLALTAVRFFSDAEDPPSPTSEVSVRLPGVRGTGQAGGEGRPTVRSRPQPPGDPLSFRGRQKDGPLLLEHCSVTERALSGTVRVRGTGAEKAVHVRATFDCGHRDMPCAPLPQRLGPADAELFTFHIPLPENLDPRECLEFCISFRLGGQSTPLWEGSKGQNYRIHVCPELDPATANTHASHRSLTLPARRKGLWEGLPRSTGHRLDYPNSPLSPQSSDIFVMPSRGSSETPASPW